MSTSRSLTFSICLLFAVNNANGASFNTRVADGKIEVFGEDRPLVTYQLEKPKDSRVPIESACYFHPLVTPKGVTITDVAPSDHLHHRGIFFAWVEMHGTKSADFWGWGEHAPKQNRKIVNVGTAISTTESSATFVANNEWRAEDHVMIREEVKTIASIRESANVLRIEYTLTPAEDIKLPQWAFSGFCARVPKSENLIISSPDGTVNLPAPHHMKPDSDWPDKNWYDFSFRSKSGKVAGLAIINHPSNPKTLWHNIPGIGMINPCIVAPNPIQLRKNVPLKLIYTVVAHDGPAPTTLLNQLSSASSKGE
ncbi:MAG: DUF6807 family protein [Verrucomicrobiota bacterium]|nr:DUF6807 family protein [Verrucomicrobiota bacterium]